MPLEGKIKRDLRLDISPSRKLELGKRGMVDFKVTDGVRLNMCREVEELNFLEGKKRAIKRKKYKF